MSHFLVLLVLLMTTFLSGLFSPASAQFSMRGSYGSNDVQFQTPPGDVLALPLHVSTISNFCITEESSAVSCASLGEDNLPHGTQLIFTNPDVAEISSENNTEILLKSLGSTTLQLREDGKKDGKILASFVLVVTPDRPGTRCVGDSSRIVDCAGKCAPPFFIDASERLGDGVCDDGITPRRDGKPLIDLSCAAIPDVFLGNSKVLEDLSDVMVFDQSGIRIDNPTDQGIAITFDPVNSQLPSLQPGINTYISISPSLSNRFSLNGDGGDCSPEESCNAQFGTAPDYKFCPAITSASVCSFNATIGFNAPTGHGTCAAMCQQFGSRCVAALDNDPLGCTPSPKSRGTCETPRQTAICVCERR